MYKALRTVFGAWVVVIIVSIEVSPIWPDACPLASELPANGVHTQA